MSDELKWCSDIEARFSGFSTLSEFASEALHIEEKFDCKIGSESWWPYFAIIVKEFTLATKGRFKSDIQALLDFIQDSSERFHSNDSTQSHIKARLESLSGYFMMTYGETQVDEIYCGATKNDVVRKARRMINSWPEYSSLDDEEVIRLAELGETEFDLVRITGDLPAAGATESELIAIYQSQWGG